MLGGRQALLPEESRPQTESSSVGARGLGRGAVTQWGQGVGVAVRGGGRVARESERTGGHWAVHVVKATWPSVYHGGGGGTCNRRVNP